MKTTNTEFELSDDRLNDLRNAIAIELVEQLPTTDPAFIAQLADYVIKHCGHRAGRCT
jgi:hypothetical protein